MTKDQISALFEQTLREACDAGKAFDFYRLYELIEEKAREEEREAIMDEWWMCVQSDLENGVKSLNERAAEKWKKEYPAIAGFAATIEARGKEA